MGEAMMRARSLFPAHTAAPVAFSPAPRRKMVFRLFQDDRGNWCARTDDGLVGGTFFDRQAALRFARRECIGMPLLVLAVARETPRELGRMPVEPLRELYAAV